MMSHGPDDGTLGAQERTGSATRHSLPALCVPAPRLRRQVVPARPGEFG